MRRLPLGLSVPLIFLPILTLPIDLYAGSPEVSTIEALNLTGFRLLSQGRPANAIPLFLEALEADPTLAFIHNNLGIAFLKIGDSEGALKAFEKASSLELNNAKYIVNMAVANWNLGHQKKAQQLIEKAKNIDPSYVEERSRGWYK